MPQPLPHSWRFYTQDAGLAQWLIEVDLLLHREQGLSLSNLDPDMLGAHDAYEAKRSSYDFYQYILWVGEVDKLCRHFLFTDFWQLDPQQFMPYDYFESSLRPEQFFSVVVMPILQDDFGSELDETVGEVAVWGHRRGR